MDFAELAKSKAFDLPDNSEILKEKPLKGRQNLVLRKICIKKDGLANDVRLCISQVGVKTSAVFGGETSSLISPDECEYFYNKIDSEEDFYRLSESIRRKLLKVL